LLGSPSGSANIFPEFTQQKVRLICTINES
jgi:hypothetical protein